MALRRASILRTRRAALGSHLVCLVLVSLIPVLLFVSVIIVLLANLRRSLGSPLPDVAHLEATQRLASTGSAFRSRPSIPSEWLGMLVDQNGRIMARTRMADWFVGQPATPEYRRETAGAMEGVVRQLSLDGVPAYVAFARAG